ncbi:MAG TPA: twin-arginine translocase TatA/TatE family subunit [Candidatus Polarisedimenticolaceae bacterium]
MGSLGWTEILVLALILILLFGAKRLPDIGRGLGDGIRGFRQAMRGEEPGGDAKGGDSNSGTKP